MSDPRSLSVLVGSVSRVGGHTSVERGPQEQHLPVRVVLSLWSGSMVLQSKVHGTGSSIRCTFITLRDKKTITQKPNDWEKNLYPVLSPAAWKFREIQSVPHKETGVCWNRAGIRPGTLRAVVATILLKTGASFWISRRYGGVGRPRIRSVHGNSSRLLAFHKKWSELQNNLREYNRLFFLFGKLTSINSMTLSQFIHLLWVSFSLCVNNGPVSWDVVKHLVTTMLNSEGKWNVFQESWLCVVSGGPTMPSCLFFTWSS